MIELALLSVMFLTISAYGYSVKSVLDQELGPVEFVSIWYRHGQRAPILVYPGFQVTYPEYWPRGYGELTTRGLHGQYMLGQWLKNRYDHLIPGTGHLPLDKLSVVSSDLHRCVQSAQANLAGMFPPTGDDEWGPLDWLPIPMTTQPDQIFNIPRSECSKWSQEYNQVLKSDEYAEAAKKYSYVVTECQKIFNTTWGITNPLTLAAFVWSALPIEDLEALPMTEAERNFYRSTDEPSLVASTFQMYSKSMKRLGGYPMLQWLAKDLTTAQTNLSQLSPMAMSRMKRFAIYSVKDNTLIGLMNSLSVTVSSSPIPTATLLFELRQAPNGTTYVTLLFRNTYDFNDEPTLVELPGCSHPCTLSTFLDVTKGLMPGNWEEECKMA